MDLPENLTQYTLEGAGAFLVIVIAYKIYKMRIALSSDCCEHAFRLKTSSRGGEQTDLELGSFRQNTEK